MTLSGTFAPGAKIRACLTALPTYAAAPRSFGAARSDTLPSFSVTGLAKNALTSAVASAGDRPPTSTWPPIVTPAAIVVGRGVVGVGVVVVVVVVVVGGGGGVVVVPVVVGTC